MNGKMIAICLLGAALSLRIATTGELAKAKTSKFSLKNRRSLAKSPEVKTREIGKRRS